MIEFFNELHLGDCLLQLHYLRNVVDNTDESFVFYVDKQYLLELSKHVINYENRIIIKSLEYKTSSAINCWIGDKKWLFNYYSCDYSYDYNRFYIDWFKQMSTTLNINYILDSMIFNYKEILKYKPEKPYDIILVNSIGYSCGINHNDEEWNRLAYKLNDKYKIITTRKINGIECTLDSNMSLVQIAGTAIGCTSIIGIHTSPIHMCFNIWSIENIKKLFVIDFNNSFSFIDTTQLKGYHEFNEIYNYYELDI